MSIISQLTNVYLSKETWHKHKLSEAEANAYHERLLVNGNILTYVKSGVLLGYLEYWRINCSQLGRIIIGEPILTDVEDILNGPIAYINNMYIVESERAGEVFEMLGTMFLVKNKDADVFVACQNGKKHKPIQVYKHEELTKLYTKGI